MTLRERFLCKPRTITRVTELQPLEYEDYPALFRAADTYSSDQQTVFFWVFGTELFLLLSATAISLVNLPLSSLAVVQAIALFGALGCAVYLFSTKPDRHWYSSRAVAESVKTLTWRYVTRAEPFDGDDTPARGFFRKRLKEIVDQNTDVAQRFTTDLDSVQLTTTMKELRNSGFASRKRAYVSGRIVEQQDWYAKKNRMNSCRAKRAFVVLVVVVSLAGLFAVLKVQFPKAAFWPTHLFVALATTILAWTQAKRFSDLAAAYSLAAVEISNVRLQAADVTNDLELSSFVGDAENAFSREHTQWSARKDT